MDNKKVSKDLFKNTAIIAIGQISTKFISFFLMPLYTALLVEEEYGLLDLLNTYSTLIVVLVGIQIHQGLFRFIVTQRDNREGINRTISSSLALLTTTTVLYTIVFFVVSPFIRISHKWFLLSLTYSQLLFQFTTCVTRGLGDNKKYAMASFLSAALTIVLNVIGIAVLRRGVVAMLYSSVIGNAFGVTYLIIAKKLWTYISPKLIRWNEIKKILKYTIPLIPNELSWSIIHSSDRIVISNLISIAANGLIAVASKFSVIYTTCFSFFNTSWTEQVFLHYKDNGGTEYIAIMFDKMVTFFASLAIGIIVCMPFAFGIMVDSGYQQAYGLIPIYLVAVFFNAVIGMISAIYLVHKETGMVAFTTGIAAAINVIVDLLLVGRIGIYAAPVSSVMGYAVVSIWRLIDINRRHCKITMGGRKIVVLLVLTAVSLIGYYSEATFFQLWILILVAAITLMMNKTIIIEMFAIIKWRN